MGKGEKKEGEDARMREVESFQVEVSSLDLRKGLREISSLVGAFSSPSFQNGKTEGELSG